MFLDFCIESFIHHVLLFHYKLDNLVKKSAVQRIQYIFEKNISKTMQPCLFVQQKLRICTLLKIKNSFLIAVYIY
jgi:hypothetical protein